jgi:hypothetical protein
MNYKSYLEIKAEIKFQNLFLIFNGESSLTIHDCDSSSFGFCFGFDQSNKKYRFLNYFPFFVFRSVSSQTFPLTKGVRTRFRQFN